MVDITRVYNTVLSILNKEQRGYITPEEFTQFAIQAQREIFENYFFELGRAERQYGPMKQMYGNIPAHIKEKLEEFEMVTSGTTVPADSYRIQTVLLRDAANSMDYPVKKVMHGQIDIMRRSELTAPTVDSAVYTRVGNTLTVFPSGDVLIHYIADISADPSITGVAVNGEFMAGTSTNFELHPSEEPELVAKILAYAGVSVRAVDVAQIAGQKDQSITQSEQ